MLSQLYRYGLKTVDVGRIVVSIITMPGTVLHEIGHVCGCVLTDTYITEIRFWQWQNYLEWEQDEQLQGRVSHLRADQPWKGVLISAFPLMLCLTCGALLYVLAERLPLWYSLIAFACGSIFIFHMSLSDRDVANIEQYTAGLSGFEATVRDAFVRASQSDGLPIISIAAGAVLVFGLPLLSLGFALAGYAIAASLFLVSDWWRAR